jgi:hypothetical protein
MREQERSYEVKSIPFGFEIFPKNETRPPLTVTVNSEGFWIFNGDTHEWNNNVPLYGFYDLVDRSAQELYKTWVSPKTGKDVYGTPVKLNKWMRHQTAKCLNKRVHLEWERLVSGFEPSMQTLHKRLFSLSVGKGYWRNAENVIKENNPYLISDILSYKAAATSVLFDPRETWRQDWVLSFANNGIKYHSLMRTLMNLPNNIVYGLLPRLYDIRLPEPVFTRLRLLAYLCLPPLNPNPYINVIVRSSDEDIKKAVKLMWHYFPSPRTGGFKNTREIMRAFSLIYDYAGIIGNWNMLGLSRRSEEYHHNLELQRRLQGKKRSRVKNSRSF